MSRMGARSPLSVRRTRALKRAKQALEMRIAGHTFPEIAEAVGYSSRSVAYIAVKRHLARVQVQVDDLVNTLRGLQGERIEECVRLIQDDLHARAMPEALQLVEDAEDVKTKLAALDYVRQIKLDQYRAIHTLMDLLKRQADLFGLDAAKKQEIAATMAIAQQMANAFLALDEEAGVPDIAAYTVLPGPAGHLGEEGDSDGD